MKSSVFDTGTGIYYPFCAPVEPVSADWEERPFITDSARRVYSRVVGVVTPKASLFITLGSGLADKESPH